MFCGGQLVEYLKMKPDGLVTVLREPCVNQNNASIGMVLFYKTVNYYWTVYNVVVENAS